MAVRNLDDGETLKMNVVMKDGREFLGCDAAPKPQGEAERVVGFWYENAIRMVPLQDVLYVDFYNDTPD